MKILHIIPSYLPAYGYGGPIVSVHLLNKWLVRKGADVTVYTTNIDGRKRLNVPLNREVNIDGVKVFYFPITFAPWQYSFGMQKALKRNVSQFDLIHITSVFLSASTLGCFYARKYRKPHIISPRGSLMREPLERKNRFFKKVYVSLVEKRNLASATAIHFTVEAEKEEYLAAGLPFKNSFIVPNGVDLEKLDKKPKSKFPRGKFGILPERKMILFLGRLSWKKGFDTLIPAFKRVLSEEPKAVLVIAGGDNEGYKKQIERFLREKDLKEGSDVVFTGMLEGEEKRAALEDASIFVLPSYSENFGMATVEAMVHGVPVVVTRGVGISSLVRRNGAGIVVDKNVEEVAGGILKILGDAKLREKLGREGEKLVREEFSPEGVAEKFFDEYRKLIHY